MHDNIICSVRNRFIALCCSRCLNPTGALYCLQAGTALCLVLCPSLALPSWSPQSTPSTTAPMLAFQAFHLAAYHFPHGTFQPTATISARGCSELDSLLGGNGSCWLERPLGEVVRSEVERLEREHWCCGSAPRRPRGPGRARGTTTRFTRQLLPVHRLVQAPSAL